MVFRPYDIRGVADRDLKDELVQKIGRGLGRMLRRGGPEGAPPRIVVGRDCRASGPRLFDALVHGLVDGGVDVIDVGVGPTPLMYFGVRSLDADGGVMITGGHDPKEINGFKITRSSGRFVGEDLEKLEAWVAGAPPPLGIQGSLETIMVEDGYLDRLEKLELADPGMKVVVDAGNGAAGPIALRALRGLGITPTALNCRMDGSFPNHDPDPLVAEKAAYMVGLLAPDNQAEAMTGLAAQLGNAAFPVRFAALLALDHIAGHAVYALGEGRRALTKMRGDERGLRRGKDDKVAALGHAVLVDPEGPIGKRPRRVDENCMVVAPAGQRGTCRKRRRKRADHQPSPGVRGARGKRLS